MDKADSFEARESPESDGFEPRFAKVIPLTGNMLREELSRLELTVPLTEEASQFLQDVVAPLTDQIPREADFFAWKEKLAQLTRETFQILVAAGALGVPENLPKREPPMKEMAILHIRREKKTDAPIETHDRAVSRIDRLICHTRLLFEMLKIYLSGPLVENISKAHIRRGEIRSRIERTLADSLFLDKALERYGGRWNVQDESRRAFMISRDIERTKKQIQAADEAARTLRHEQPVKKRTLRAGAAAYTAIQRAEDTLQDFEEARAAARNFMQQPPDASLPEVISVKVPVTVDRKVVIDCLADNPNSMRDRLVQLINRQMQAPVPLALLMQSLMEYGGRAQPSGQGPDPFLVIHEIVRRAAADTDGQRSEILRRGLLQTIFDEGRPLLAPITEPRTIRVSHIERLSDGPLKGQDIATVNKIVGFEPWMPN